MNRFDLHVKMKVTPCSFINLNFASFHFIFCPPPFILFYFQYKKQVPFRGMLNSPKCSKSLSLYRMNSDTRDLDFSRNKIAPGHFKFFSISESFFFFFNEDMLKQNLGNLGYTLNICICQTHAFNTEKNYKLNYAIHKIIAGFIKHINS